MTAAMTPAPDGGGGVAPVGTFSFHPPPAGTPSPTERATGFYAEMDAYASASASKLCEELARRSLASPEGLHAIFSDVKSTILASAAGPYSISAIMEGVARNNAAIARNHEAIQALAQRCGAAQDAPVILAPVRAPEKSGKSTPAPPKDTPAPASSYAARAAPKTPAAPPKAPAAPTRPAAASSTVPGSPGWKTAAASANVLPPTTEAEASFTPAPLSKRAKRAKKMAQSGPVEVVTPVVAPPALAPRRRGDRFLWTPAAVYATLPSERAHNVRRIYVRGLPLDSGAHTARLTVASMARVRIADVYNVDRLHHDVSEVMVNGRLAAAIGSALAHDPTMEVLQDQMQRSSLTDEQRRKHYERLDRAINRVYVPDNVRAFVKAWRTELCAREPKPTPPPPPPPASPATTTPSPASAKRRRGRTGTRSRKAGAASLADFLPPAVAAQPPVAPPAQPSAQPAVVAQAETAAAELPGQPVVCGEPGPAPPHAATQQHAIVNSGPTQARVDRVLRHIKKHAPLDAAFRLHLRQDLVVKAVIENMGWKGMSGGPSVMELCKAATGGDKDKMTHWRAEVKKAEYEHLREIIMGYQDDVARRRDTLTPEHCATYDAYILRALFVRIVEEGKANVVEAYAAADLLRSTCPSPLELWDHWDGPLDKCPGVGRCAQGCAGHPSLEETITRAVQHVRGGGRPPGALPPDAAQRARSKLEVLADPFSYGLTEATLRAYPSPDEDMDSEPGDSDSGSDASSAYQEVNEVAPSHV